MGLFKSFFFYNLSELKNEVNQLKFLRCKVLDEETFYLFKNSA